MDLNEVPGLSGYRQPERVSCRSVPPHASARPRRSPVVAERLPLLTEALPQIGHVSIRNRGTIGGSIAHADASAELPAVAIITGAEMVVRSAAGERSLPADEFFLGHFTTALDDDELLLEVRVPVGPAGAGWAFHEVARRHGDFALVGVAAMVTLDADSRIDEARLCMIGVADRAMRPGDAEASLVGSQPGVDAFTVAAEEAVKDLEPASDVHGSLGVPAPSGASDDPAGARGGCQPEREEEHERRDRAGGQRRASERPRPTCA